MDNQNADGKHPHLAPEMRPFVSVQDPSLTPDLDEMRRVAIEGKRQWNERQYPTLSIERGSVDGAVGPRPMLDVRPPAERDTPIVHIHGGGWAMCDLDTHRAVLAEIALTTGMRVLAPHARRAPESPYPAPLDDTISAIRDIAERLGRSVFLSGDSAGANLALAAALRCRDEGRPLPVRAMSLFFGCYRRVFDTPSHRAYGDGRAGLSTAKMRHFWALYAPNEAPYADLSDAGFQDLPPVQVQIAEVDALADDSRWLAEAVQSAGGTAEVVTWPGMAHGFLHYPPDLKQIGEAYRAMKRFLEASG